MGVRDMQERVHRNKKRKRPKPKTSELRGHGQKGSAAIAGEEVLDFYIHPLDEHTHRGPQVLRGECRQNPRQN